MEFNRDSNDIPGDGAENVPGVDGGSEGSFAIPEGLDDANLLTPGASTAADHTPMPYDVSAQTGEHVVEGHETGDKNTMPATYTTKRIIYEWAKAYAQKGDPVSGGEVLGMPGQAGGYRRELMGPSEAAEKIELSYFPDIGAVCDVVEVVFDRRYDAQSNVVGGTKYTLRESRYGLDIEKTHTLVDLTDALKYLAQARTHDPVQLPEAIARFMDKMDEQSAEIAAGVEQDRALGLAFVSEAEATELINILHARNTPLQSKLRGWIRRLLP